MSNIEQTMLEMVNHFIQRHPQFAGQIESICATAQGKGFGTASITQEVEAVFSLLQAAPRLAVDIGGNIGEYTAQLRSRQPTLEVHVFEPALTNINALRTRFHNDAAVHLVPSAVARESGASTLFADAAGSGMASLSKRKLDHFGIHFTHSETISTIRFEDYWTDVLKCRPIDIVKLDIEGHEMAALESFGAAIDSTKIIQFEFGGANIDTRTFFQDFWYFFKTHQFAMYRVTPFGHSPIADYRETDEYFSTTNYLAVRLPPATTASQNL